MRGRASADADAYCFGVIEPWSRIAREDGVAPGERLPGLDEGVVGGRCLGQPGEQRGLAQVEVARGFEK